MEVIELDISKLYDNNILNCCEFVELLKRHRTLRIKAHRFKVLYERCVDLLEAYEYDEFFDRDAKDVGVKVENIQKEFKDADIVLVVHDSYTSHLVIIKTIE